MENNELKRKASDELEASKPKKRGRNERLADTEAYSDPWPPYFEHVRK